MKSTPRVLRKAVAALLASATADIVNATAYQVTNTFNSGAGSLRQAITDSNLSDNSADTITFGVTGTISLSSALPTIGSAASVGALTITGPGTSSLTISGDTGDSNRNFRLFEIGSGGNLTITASTISGAKTTTLNGGGLYNRGALSISDCVLTNNWGRYGGGIANNGTLTVSNSIISNNKANNGGGSGSGGGIWNTGSGSFTITNSTISSNTSNFGGGGVSNYGSGASQITGSTLSSNTGANGGAILNDRTLTMTNSTVSSNIGNIGGGGINNQNAGNLTILKSTISLNTTNGNGGGIYNNGTISLANSTVSGNTATGAGGGISAYLGNTAINSTTISGNSGALPFGVEISIT